MNGLLVGTTQNVTLEYQPASIGERLGAYLLDLIILIAWGIGMGGLLSWALRGRFNENPRSLAAVLLLIVLPIVLYDLLCELLLNGQSIGKKAVNIRVVMLDGGQPTLGAYLIRWVFRLVEFTLFWGVPALVCIAVTGRGQRLGDLVAKTSVIKLRPPVTLEQVVRVPKMATDAYSPTFPEAALLTDRDATTLRLALDKGLLGNEELLEAAAAKARELMGIESEFDNVRFLQTVLQDYTYFSLQEKT